MGTWSDSEGAMLLFCMLTGTLEGYLSKQVQHGPWCNGVHLWGVVSWNNNINLNSAWHFGQSWVWCKTVEGQGSWTIDTSIVGRWVLQEAVLLLEMYSWNRRAPYRRLILCQQRLARRMQRLRKKQTEKEKWWYWTRLSMPCHTEQRWASFQAQQLSCQKTQK